jgi:hypothetical protein
LGSNAAPKCDPTIPPAQSHSLTIDKLIGRMPIEAG